MNLIELLKTYPKHSQPRPSGMTYGGPPPGVGPPPPNTNTSTTSSSTTGNAGSMFNINNIVSAASSGLAAAVSQSVSIVSQSIANQTNLKNKPNHLNNKGLY